MPLIGALIALGVLLMVMGVYAGGRYGEIELPQAWQIQLGAPVEQIAMQAGGGLSVLTQNGELIQVDAGGVKRGSWFVHPAELVGLSGLGALVHREGYLYLEALDAPPLPVGEFRHGDQAFVTRDSLIVASAAQQGYAVGDHLYAWRSGELVASWEWPDSVLLHVAKLEDGYVGIFLDTLADELSISLCKFETEGTSWQLAIGDHLASGLATVPGQVLLAVSRQLTAYDASGTQLWNYQARSPICCLAAGSGGTLIVEALGSLKRHRISSIDPFGQLMWARTVAGNMTALQAGSRLHVLLIDGRLWLLNASSGRVSRTPVSAVSIHLDRAGNSLITVSEEGDLTCFLLD